MTARPTWWIAVPGEKGPDGGGGAGAAVAGATAGCRSTRQPPGEGPILHRGTLPRTRDRGPSSQGR